jgi:hypothetical protein
VLTGLISVFCVGRNGIFWSDLRACFESHLTRSICTGGESLVHQEIPVSSHGLARSADRSIALCLRRPCSRSSARAQAGRHGLEWQGNGNESHFSSRERTDQPAPYGTKKGRQKRAQKGAKGRVLRHRSNVGGASVGRTFLSAPQSVSHFAPALNHARFEGVLFTDLARQ